MTPRDVYLLSPELALVGVALAVILLDLFIKRKGLLAVLTIMGLLIPFALGIVLWAKVNTDGVQVGIFNTLVVDKFALFFKFLVLAIVGLVVMASVDYVKKLERYQGEYYGLILFSAAGMMLLAATRELISIYISLELTALPLAALVAFLMTDRSSEAAMKFLILSAISSAMLLFGMTLVFGFTGTTYLAEIAQTLTGPGEAGVPFGSYALLLGVILIVAGFGFKISSVPFQMWVPDVYEGGPTPVVAYLSVASKAAGFAILLRVFYTAFQGFDLDWVILFAGLSAASMTIGNVVAIAQNNIKRLLGYSTIAHAGYLLVGLAAISQGGQGDTLGPSSMLFYLGAYAVTNLAAFFAIIAITNKIGSHEIDDFAGMSRRAPVLSLILALSMISLIGLPPTGIFIAKVYIFTAAIKSGLLWLAVVGVVNSVISAYYYLRIVRVMYLAPPPSEEAVPSSGAARLSLAVTGIGVLFVGIIPGPLLRLAEVAVVTIIT